MLEETQIANPCQTSQTTPSANHDSNHAPTVRPVAAKEEVASWRVEGSVAGFA